MYASLCCTVSGKVLQDMMSGSSAGSAPLSVDTGRHLPSNMYNPIPTILSSYWHLLLSSTLYDSILEGVGTFQLPMLVAEHVVPHAMYL